MCWLFAGLGMGVAMMGLSALERARGGRCAGVCAACCGAMRRSRGGGGARACRGQGAGVMCDGAADFVAYATQRSDMRTITSDQPSSAQTASGQHTHTSRTSCDRAATELRATRRCERERERRRCIRDG